MTSKAQQAAVNKYIKKNYDRINLTLPKGKKEKLEEIARSQQKSTNQFLNEIIDEEIKKER